MVELGKVLNQRYKIVKYIGSGGTATVYLGKDLILDRPVAIKMLRYDFLHDEKSLKRFQHEAQAISLLAHPNIVSLYDVDEDAQNQYLVMEYVEGTDLKKYIQQYKPLTVTEAIQIMLQIIEAVSQAHAQNIIHRDLKTQNILIRRDKIIKITDFGIATGFSEISMTQTNTLIGSIHYLSPEQTRGQRATKQSDIYALGIILYELIMGEVPFKGDTAVSIAMKHFQSPMPSVVASAKQTVPQSLENVILRATAKNPKNRYDSCQEMLQDLKTCLRLERQNEPKYVEPDTNVKPVSPNFKTPVFTREPATSVNHTKETLNKPKPKSNKWKWPMVVFGTLFTLLFTLLVIHQIIGENASILIPDVSGKTQLEATKALNDIGLIVETIQQEENQAVSSGQVIKTVPQAQANVKKNSKVILVVSSGYSGEIMENYKGKDYTSAYKELINKGYIVERKSASSATVPNGHVISQSVQAGQKVIPKDTIVTLTVSTGPITLKDYTKQNYESIKTELEGLGFKVSQKVEENVNVEPGYIISQSIPANTQVDPTTTTEISFVVSSGLHMPDFSEWNRQAVETQLRKLGLRATFRTAYSETVPINTVIEQSVKANEIVTSTTPITITISLGKQETSTTNTTTTTTTTTTIPNNRR
ncbi:MULTISPECIES: Stk1 family PASTA domain-containing Ser/Thr kinase [unclassified Granulicatella]|uniref:Stk1 family PASTA domain-containing Ser/Thr kinase n=1 Tax=unclassified Granulicatella TaxID=2630493 RepID=UPI0010742B32|nr:MULTISPECIES: Stk1 family PASTA domain-containing Ser/Thr kinase [unclassified Granulicatella]MBF0780652.1 Stk1 family PASTA domain-containing Ser/Thr kinase [Granulicatella sp. 19428wC4_WM01]TFU94553.1 Stk1 family PASTA domain-containing Ser/Thr kinase [Granulicatella sp. WM01]